MRAGTGPVTCTRGLTRRGYRSSYSPPSRLTAYSSPLASWPNEDRSGIVPSWTGCDARPFTPVLKLQIVAGAVVAVEVPAAHRRNGRAAVDVAADDGADRAVCDVRPHRTDEHALLRQLDLRVVDHRAFEAAPAVVREHRRPSPRPEVDLLVLGRADVADPEVARLPVEREPPRVAEPEPDRLPRRARAVRRDPQQLAERAAEILRVVLRVAGGDVAGGGVGAAVAEADVERPGRSNWSWPPL